MSIGTDIYERSLVAMNDLIGRIVRAERMSGMKEGGSLKNMRDQYLNVSAPGGAEAHEILMRFIHLAQWYYERAKSNDTYIKQWTRFEDQRLRKPIARLVRLQAESQKWQALRRLQSPANGPIKFFQPPKGTPAKIFDFGERPLFSTFMSAKVSR